MSISEDLFIIRNHFFDNWSEDVPTVLDNQPNEDQDENEIWCRFSIQMGASQQTTFGHNPIFLQLGRVYLQVFVPEQSGISSGMEIVDDFVSIWRSRYVGDIYFKSPEIQQGSRSLDGGKVSGDDYYQINCSIPFESEKPDSI